MRFGDISVSTYLVAPRHLCQPAVVESASVIWLESDGLIIVQNSPVILTLLGVYAATPEEGTGIVWPESNGLIIVLESSVVLTLRIVGEATVVEGVGKSRRQRKNNRASR